MGVFGNGYINKRIDLVAEATIELENEMTSFNRLFDAIEVMNENSIILEFSFKDIIEKIKELWHKFTAWVKRIWDKIFHRNKVASKNVEEAKKNYEEAKKVVQQATPEQVEAVRNATKENIEKRHEEANKEIEASKERIKKNGEELDKSHEEIEKELKKQSVNNSRPQRVAASTEDEEEKKPASIIPKTRKQKIKDAKVPTTTVTKTDDKGKEQKIEVAPKKTEEDLIDIDVKCWRSTVGDLFIGDNNVQNLCKDPSKIIAMMAIIGTDSFTITTSNIKEDDKYLSNESISHWIERCTKDINSRVDSFCSQKIEIRTDEVTKEKADKERVKDIIKAVDGLSPIIDMHKTYKEGLEHIIADLNEGIKEYDRELKDRVGDEEKIKDLARECIADMVPHKTLNNLSDEKQKAIEKYIDVMASKIPTIISNDIARLQKIVAFLSKALNTCNTVLDNYAKQYDKLTTAISTPV